jgi:hypothetical protein
MHYSPEEYDRLLAEALGGVSRVEQALFGHLLRTQVRTIDSSFERQLGKFGPAGSAKLFVTHLWLLPAGVLFFLMVFFGAITRSYEVIFAFLAIIMVIVLITVYALATAYQEGRRYRASQGE